MINYTCDRCGKRCGQSVFYGRRWLSIDLADDTNQMNYHFCPTCAESLRSYITRYVKGGLKKKRR